MASKSLTQDEKLQKLVSFRKTNIQNILRDWTEEDFTDMRHAFKTAKEIALEKDNDFSAKLNEEKLSQLEEAWSLKSKSNKRQKHIEEPLQHTQEATL